MDLSLRELLSCSKDERAVCIETADMLVELAQTAKKKGFAKLGSDKVIKETGNELLKEGVELIMSGTEPAYVKRIMENRALFSDAVGGHLMNMLITSEGIQMIQQGAEPELIRTLLYSFFSKEDLESI